MLARYREPDRPRLIEGFLAYVAGLVVVAFVALIVVVLFLFAAKPSLAQIRPPHACVQLAKLYGFTVPDNFTREQAEAALSQLNVRMILVPEARRCRAAIISELKK